MNNKLQRAKANLIISHPFYASLALNAKWIPAEDIYSSATDGVNFYYNPKVYEQITYREIMAEIVHEVLHKVMAHVSRRGERKLDIYNEAADYAINLIMEDAGFKFSPKFPGLINEDYRGMTSEEIYEILIKENQDSGVKPAHLLPLPDEISPEEVEQMVKIELATAVSASKLAGKELPYDIKQMVKQALSPKLEWKILLQKFLNNVSSGQDDTSYRRFSRRGYALDIPLPQNIGYSIAHICIAFDTSGSIFHEKELTDKFIAEIKSIFSKILPTLVTVIYCDTQICGHDTFTEGQEFLPNLVGGGGTHFDAPIRYINGLNPNCIIFFTDMETNGFGQTTIPILWVNYGRETKAPYGQIINIKE